MTENVTPSHAIQKSPRPIGVWILTVYALIFAGGAPVFASILLLISGNFAANVVSVLFSLPLSIAIVFSSIGAWQGKERARKSLLIFVTLHYAFIGLNNYLAISSGLFPDDMQPQLWARVIRGVLYPAVYIWYFNKISTREFYR